MDFPEFVIAAGSCCVEVSEGYVFYFVNFVIGFEEVLYQEFCNSVWVCRFSFGFFFYWGFLWFSEYCCR